MVGRELDRGGAKGRKWGTTAILSTIKKNNNKMMNSRAFKNVCILNFYLTIIIEIIFLSIIICFNANNVQDLHI